MSRHEDRPGGAGRVDGWVEGLGEDEGAPAADGDPTAGSEERPRPRAARALLVGSAAVAALALAVVALRPDAPPEPAAADPQADGSASPAAPPALRAVDLVGLGGVRVGMSYDDYRRVESAASSGAPAAPGVAATDEADGCRMYAVRADGDVVRFVWVVDAVVVAAGLVAAPDVDPEPAGSRDPDPDPAHSPNPDPDPAGRLALGVTVGSLGPAAQATMDRDGALTLAATGDTTDLHAPGEPPDGVTYVAGAPWSSDRVGYVEVRTVDGVACDLGRGSSGAGLVPALDIPPGWTSLERLTADPRGAAAPTG